MVTLVLRAPNISYSYIRIYGQKTLLYTYIDIHLYDNFAV